MVSLTSASKEVVSIETLRPHMNGLTSQLLSLCKYMGGGGEVKGGEVKGGRGR